MMFERLALARLRQLIAQSDNFSGKQSAYRQYHSTETALLSILMTFTERLMKAYVHSSSCVHVGKSRQVIGSAFLNFSTIQNCANALVHRQHCWRHHIDNRQREVVGCHNRQTPHTTHMC